MSASEVASADPKALSTVQPSGVYKLIFASSLGNALEWFDLIVYGFFAVTIGKLFFPSENDAVSLILAMGTFALSYIVRPLGAIVLGAYADRVGRKAAMMISIWLMMFGMLIIALMPTYQTIGILAPVGIFIARLLQGFSAGGEFGSATALLVEKVPEKRGLISSFMFASQGVSLLLGSGFGLALTTLLTQPQLESWGWRIPFIFGLLIGPVGIYIRRQIPESEVLKHHKNKGMPVAQLLQKHKRSVLLAIGSLILSTSVSYVIIFIPAFASKQLGLPASQGYATTLMSGVILTLFTPFVGHLSDRIGRTRIMLIASALFFITVIPAFYWLSHSPVLVTLMTVLMWLTLLKVFYFGGLPALMSDLFEPEVRASGLALSYNITTTAFGSVGPLIIAWMISMTHSDIAPSFYLIFTSLVSFVTLMVIRFRRKIH